MQGASLAGNEKRVIGDRETRAQRPQDYKTTRPLTTDHGLLASGKRKERSARCKAQLAASLNAECGVRNAESGKRRIGLRPGGGNGDKETPLNAECGVRNAESEKWRQGDKGTRGTRELRAVSRDSDRRLVKWSICQRVEAQRAWRITPSVAGSRQVAAGRGHGDKETRRQGEGGDRETRGERDIGRSRGRC